MYQTLLCAQLLNAENPHCLKAGALNDQYDEDERRFTEFMQKEYERIRQEACERMIMTDIDLRDMKFKLSNSLRETNHTTGGKMPQESMMFNTP